MSPNCYDCVHRRNLVGDCHSRCNNIKATVTADSHGIKQGWFIWPLNFDPVWLRSCDGFSDDPKDNLPENKVHPIFELFSLLKR